MQQQIINGYRLSPQQERLWPQQNANSAFCARALLQLDGQLDSMKLNNALAQIVERHEILRTTFTLPTGMSLPVQVVHEELPAAPIDESQVNGSPISNGQMGREHNGSTKKGAVSASGFDIADGPLLHATLQQISSEKHLLTLTLPALCADMWSLNNLVQEIAAAYATSESAPSDLLNDEEDEPLQYVQFSEWQHEILEDEDAESGATFWMQQNLSDYPALTFPLERKTDADVPFVTASAAIDVDDNLAQKLTTLVEVRNSNMHDLLLCAWQVLIWRLTGEQELLIGDICNGRQHEMLFDAIGLFARWLPIPHRFEPNHHFVDLLSQISQKRADSYEWQDYFDSSLLSDDGISVGFEFSEREDGLKASNLSISILQQQSTIERFGLKLSCTQIGRTLAVELFFDETRFDRSDVVRIGQNFTTLLESIVADSELEIGSLNLLSDEERQQLLIDANETAADFPTHRSLHQLFEEQAARTPTASAVIFKEQQLNYLALNSRANQLAHHLRELGVGSDIAVGLCMERSIDMLVGLLGILKAGGAYLPLDPMYPKDRLSFTLSDAAQLKPDAPSIVVTQSQLVGNLPAEDVTLIAIDTDWETIAQQPDTNVESDGTVDNLAYIIYTSGSTGNPKGVMIEHRSVVNLAFALQKAVYEEANLGESQRRVSLNAPLTFDSSVKQLVQLLFGHTLVIVPEEARPDGQALLDYVAHNDLDILDCTPIQLRLLLEADLLTNADAPAAILVGGEAIDDIMWNEIQGCESIHFFNVYGPTECTVDATVCAVNRASDTPTLPHNGHSVIGRAIPNVQTYILDERQQPVPIGTIGELYIGGAGVARGYVMQSELTEEKFVKHPFMDDRSEHETDHQSSGVYRRLYRTGDLAYYLPDGNILFAGRSDHQVKVRGFRIELGEIEAVLAQHEAVRESAVIVREDTPGNPHLVGYVTIRRGADVQTADLRQLLREKLPEYMVPNAFVILNDMPLNRHGKVDRKALPAPDKARREAITAYVAPRSALEETIAAIWQEVLEVDKVGVDDNFFDLGGHSLLMVRVHNKLREALEKDISLIDMFRNPSVGLLAEYFSQTQDEEPTFEKAQERADRRREAQSRRRERTARRRERAG